MLTNTLDLLHKPLFAAMLVLAAIDAWNTAQGGILAFDLSISLDALMLALWLALCVIAVRRYQAREQARRDLEQQLRQALKPTRRAR